MTEVGPKTQIPYDSTYTKCPTEGKAQRQKADWPLLGSGGRRAGKDCSWTQVSLWGDRMFWNEIEVVVA